MEEFGKVDERKNCFGLYFEKVDTVNFDYKVVTSFKKFRGVDTNFPLLTPLITKPDIDSYNKNIETAWLYPYVTDFLAKYQTGHNFSDASDWNQRPLFNQDIGYAPMSTEDFVDLDVNIFRTISDQFPSFIQYT